MPDGLIKQQLILAENSVNVHKIPVPGRFGAVWTDDKIKLWK
jgi:hypothetical protein